MRDTLSAGQLPVQTEARPYLDVLKVLAVGSPEANVRLPVSDPRVPPTNGLELRYWRGQRAVDEITSDLRARVQNRAPVTGLRMVPSVAVPIIAAVSGLLGLAVLGGAGISTIASAMAVVLFR